MKLKCAAQDLMIGLVNATRALAARPSTPVLEYVKVAAAEGHIVLTCTDGSLTIRAEVKAEVDEEGDILLPGKLLTEIVRKLPEGVVQLSSQRKERHRDQVPAKPLDACRACPRRNSRSCAIS